MNVTTTSIQFGYGRAEAISEMSTCHTVKIYTDPIQRTQMPKYENTLFVCLLAETNVSSSSVAISHHENQFALHKLRLLKKKAREDTDKTESSGYQRKVHNKQSATSSGWHPRNQLLHVQEMRPPPPSTQANFD